MEYPHHPGSKTGDTSQLAADSMAGIAPTLRRVVLEEIKNSEGLTADEVADKIRVSILSIRPRVSELRRMGLIEDA